MAELAFFTGPMDCGKSTMALQMHHTQSSHDRAGQLFTSHDRSGSPKITSRIGMWRAAIEVDDALDFWQHTVDALTSGERVDFLICDEAQFYLPQQIDQLARVVDDLGIDVYTFGILADFRTEMFPGSKRLVELADRTELLPVQPLCWCGARGTQNARIVNGEMVVEGSQVMVGDTSGTPAAVHYEVLCRKHHRARLSSQHSGATLSPEPLPFDDA